MTSEVDPNFMYIFCIHCVIPYWTAIVIFHKSIPRAWGRMALPQYEENSFFFPFLQYS